MVVNEYKNRLSWQNILGRALWNIVYFFLFRPFGTKIFCRWRNFILCCFGAQIHSRAGVYSSAKIWCPWKLEMKENAWIGPGVNCYNADWIRLGKNVTISQGTYLCTASHDITNSQNLLITAPIIVEEQSWIAAEAFIMMGVTIGQGAVVGARACVFKDVEPWTVVGGNPAKFIKKREIKDQ
jgi:putative colanic acid biosynthesis acetyltransferase WcaF